MRTYYIEIERQGWTLAIVKVEADNYEQAELKALKALHATDDISETSRERTIEALDNGTIEYVLDEDGCEIDPEDPTLPEDLTLSIEDDLGLTDIDDEDAVVDAINTYLDCDYGVMPDDFDWEIGEDCSELYIYNIKWPRI